MPFKLVTDQSPYTSIRVAHNNLSFLDSISDQMIGENIASFEYLLVCLVALVNTGFFSLARSQSHKFSPWRSTWGGLDNAYPIRMFLNILVKEWVNWSFEVVLSSISREIMYSIFFDSPNSDPRLDPGLCQSSWISDEVREDQWQSYGVFDTLLYNVCAN